MTLLAAVALVAAVLVWLPPAPGRRLARLAASGTRRGSSRWRVLLRPLGVVATCAGGSLVGGAGGASLGFCAGLVAATGWTVWRDHRARRGARERSEQVTAACLGLAGLLRVGHVPGMALRIAAADLPVLAEAAAVQRIGGQVPAVLRRLGAEPGGDGLTELAVAWELSTRTGASLTATLDALADRLDASRALRRVVDAELAAPRATSRLLAALPLAGVALGFGFGGDPVAFLLGTAIGQLAMCVAVGLACAGVLWTEQIARRAGG